MSESIIETYNLKKYFPIKMDFFKTLTAKETPFVRAVDGVDLKIMPKEILGLVGESGCGKTTIGKLLLRLLEPTEGKVVFKGLDMTNLSQVDMRKLRRKIQIIYQDPYESLNPRMSIYNIVAEPIQIQKIAETSEETLELVSKALEDLGLVPPEEFLLRFPHELSGGQRQRVATARTLVLNPEFIVADEPVSMLDTSSRGEVLKLMLNLVHERNCAFLYITHDIALTRSICDRIAIMYLGKIMEKGSCEDIIQKPLHPYTEALLAAVPVPDPTARRLQVVIGGEVPSPTNTPSGCRFHPRCPYAQDKCRKEEPQLVASGKDRYVACHFPRE